MVKQVKYKPSLLLLGIIWLLGAVSDRFWFALDHSVPSWDQADYLTGSLNYYQALQQPHWFSVEWWTSFWLLSAKIPPLTYIATAVVQSVFGIGLDQATLVNLGFSAILLGAVFGLGVQLFSVEVGLWAAGLCQLMPGLYRFRLDFLLDYPLTAVVILCFWCLTVWRSFKTAKTQRSWWWVVGFGVSLGLALLVKQTALLFLLVPVLWVGVEEVLRRRWGRVLQLVGGLLISVLVFGPWYRTNWLLMLTAGKRATVDSAIAEGDPALNTFTAWIYYWQALPAQVSWLLLLVPIVGLLLHRKHNTKLSITLPTHLSSATTWLVIFWLGAYLLCSLNMNKDERYVLPYLPVVALFLADGLTRWGARVRWGSVGLAVILMFLNIYPVAGSRVMPLLSPNAQHYAYLGAAWPHEQVVEEVIHTAPYLRSTLGVLPSTTTINQHNFNYYGAVENFQVYSRQVGTRKQQVAQDVRSLDWFMVKTGKQGSVPDAQAVIDRAVRLSPDFYLHKTWGLPDGSNLQLYHRRILPVQVQPLSGVKVAKIALSRVAVPEQVPPGVAVPVTYEWSGTWEQLQSGLVLLNWHHQAGEGWLHDHGIGMGALYPAALSVATNQFQVTERIAMLPPQHVSAGIYTLEATYLNRQTGETYAIPVPPVTLKITPGVDPIPAPELDLVTQLHTLATALPQGPAALEPVFAEIARINQYDPIQDYLVQTQLALEYRLQQSQELDWAYTLALAKILKRQVNGAIAALERVTELDSQNPYAYAYLAFVHLYNWHGSAAQAALKSAYSLNPNIPELQILSGVAALMQGNLLSAWGYFKNL